MTTSAAGKPWDGIDLWGSHKQFRETLSEAEESEFDDYLDPAREADLETRRAEIEDELPEVDLDQPIPDDLFHTMPEEDLDRVIGWQYDQDILREEHERDASAEEFAEAMSDIANSPPAKDVARPVYGPRRPLSAQQRFEIGFSTTGEITPEMREWEIAADAALSAEFGQPVTGQWVFGWSDPLLLSAREEFPAGAEEIGPAGQDFADGDRMIRIPTARREYRIGGDGTFLGQFAYDDRQAATLLYVTHYQNAGTYNLHTSCGVAVDVSTDRIFNVSTSRAPKAVMDLVRSNNDGGLWIDNDGAQPDPRWIAAEPKTLQEAMQVLATRLGAKSLVADWVNDPSHVLNATTRAQLGGLFPTVDDRPPGARPESAPSEDAPSTSTGAAGGAAAGAAGGAVGAAGVGGAVVGSTWISSMPASPGGGGYATQGGQSQQARLAQQTNQTTDDAPDSGSTSSIYSRPPAGISDQPSAADGTQPGTPMLPGPGLALPQSADDVGDASAEEEGESTVDELFGPLPQHLQELDAIPDGTPAGVDWGDGEEPGPEQYQTWSDADGGPASLFGLSEQALAGREISLEAFGNYSLTVGKFKLIVRLENGEVREAEVPDRFWVTTTRKGGHDLDRVALSEWLGLFFSTTPDEAAFNKMVWGTGGSLGRVRDGSEAVVPLDVPNRVWVGDEQQAIDDLLKEHETAAASGGLLGGRMLIVGAIAIVVVGTLLAVTLFGGGGDSAEDLLASTTDDQPVAAQPTNAGGTDTSTVPTDDAFKDDAIPVDLLGQFTFVGDGVIEFAVDGDRIIGRTIQPPASSGIQLVGQAVQCPDYASDVVFDLDLTGAGQWFWYSSLPCARRGGAEVTVNFEVAGADARGFMPPSHPRYDGGIPNGHTMLRVRN